jgi:hypothetical protein
MVIFVRVALATTVLALGVAGMGTAGSAQAVSSNPSAAQIQRAVKRAEASKSLWATVNMCDIKVKGGYEIGVRGQMPALGFPAWLSMRVQLNYYSAKKARFVPAQHASTLLRLGRFSHGLQQVGATFTYPPAGLFNARIDFIWRREGKLLGQSSRRTTSGHPNAAYGDPKHFSAKECRIP